MDERESEEDLRQEGAQFLELSGKARLIAVILKPVMLTMIIVIWVIRSLTPETGQPSTMSGPSVATVAYQEKGDDSVGTKLFGAAANAFIFIIFIGIMTFVFVFLIKYKCYKIIYGWLIFSVISLLGMLGGIVFYKLLEAYNLGIDYITYSILLWNYAVVGLASVFGPESPEQVTHGYLVCVSVFLAWIFTNLPEWTCWMLLGFLVVYDLMAVLCPGGPLKMLVDVALDQNATIPGLLYDATIEPQNTAPGSGVGSGSGSLSTEEEGSSTSAVEASPLLMEESRANNNATELQSMEDVQGEPDIEAIGAEADAASPEASQHTEAAGQANESQQQRSEDTEAENVPNASDGGDSLKLGLGDFVFYSVLVARAAYLDVTVTASCFLAVITGLCSTLFLLAFAGKALPALPISLTLGISFYFLGVYFVRDSVNDLVLAAAMV